MIGWSVAAQYWSYTGLGGPHYNYFMGLLQFLSDVGLYILITHLYRNFSLSHSWQNLNLHGLIKGIIPAVIVLGVVFNRIFAIIRIICANLWIGYFYRGE